MSNIFNTVELLESKTLEVAGVYFHRNENNVEHHTEKFQHHDNTSILRRGQKFRIQISFTTDFHPRFHRVLLEFHTGWESRRLETSSGLLEVTGADEETVAAAGDWHARYTGAVNAKSADISVWTPSWIPFGRWTLDVRTELVHQHGFRSTTFTHPGDIYFLFNPWNRDDDTHMEDESLLQEYILSDMGNVWSWSETRPTLIWEYGQFEDLVLPALEFALDQDRLLRRHRRGSAVEVSRAISRIVSYTGTSGILVGNWSAERASYSDGRLPEYWTGSLDILQQYWRSRGRPVKYAQCWVFAGLAVTFCRAVGLPCRLVTNQASGHDTDQSLTLDFYYDETLEKERDSEGIWNFHVWCDVWMRRPDLRNPEYDGWQTIDGTPQERSQGRYQCGPTPLGAVRAGDTLVPYDVPFVLAEVNGDRARWMRTRDRIRLIDIHEKLVGQALLTDDPDSKIPRAKNVTHEYKPPEGSIPERLAIWRASSSPYLTIASRRRRELDEHRFLNDVHFSSHRPYSIQFGEDFHVELVISSRARESRTVDAKLNLQVVDHADKVLQVVKTTGMIEIAVQPGDSKTVRMSVGVREYAPGLRENSLLRFRVKCLVRETEQPWLSNEENETIEVAVPNLNIKFNEELWVGKPVFAHISLDRPVNWPLTNCYLKLGGSGLLRDGRSVQVDSVPSGEQFHLRIRVHPARAGTQKIIAKFTSNEIPKVESWVEVQVRGYEDISRRTVDYEDHLVTSGYDLDNHIVGNPY